MLATSSVKAPLRQYNVVEHVFWSMICYCRTLVWLDYAWVWSRPATLRCKSVWAPCATTRARPASCTIPWRSCWTTLVRNGSCIITDWSSTGHCWGQLLILYQLVYRVGSLMKQILIFEKQILTFKALIIKILYNILSQLVNYIIF